MKKLIEINGKQVDAYVYDSMFDYVKYADLSYRDIDIDAIKLREVSFIATMFPIKDPEFTVDMNDEVKIGDDTYVRVDFNDAVEEPIYLLLEALNEPIFLLYTDFYQGKYVTSGKVYEAYSDTYDDIEFDSSHLSNEDFETILNDIICDETIQNLLAIDDVYVLVSEHFNNEILDLCDDWNNNEAFYDATVEFLNIEGKLSILESDGVKETLDEYFNNEVIGKWEDRQWQRIYDDEPRD